MIQFLKNQRTQNTGLNARPWTYQKDTWLLQIHEFPSSIQFQSSWSLNWRHLSSDDSALGFSASHVQLELSISQYRATKQDWDHTAEQEQHQCCNITTDATAASHIRSVHHWLSAEEDMSISSFYIPASQPVRQWHSSIYIASFSVSCMISFISLPVF